MIDLLPKQFEALVTDAVRIFWRSRARGATGQEGARGSVIDGKNMDGFLKVVSAICEHCGLPDGSVYLKGRQDLTLPGFYRPTKAWDAVVVHKRRLVATFEFKSHVGSFGNNFNNRAEEAIGNAEDLRQAIAADLLSEANAVERGRRAHMDPRPPFRGYLMLLENCEASTSAKTTSSGHFRADQIFDGASYADRYRILCERMTKQRLYDACALVMSTREGGAARGEHSSLSDATSVRTLFRDFAGRVAAAV